MNGILLQNTKTLDKQAMLNGVRVESLMPKHYLAIVIMVE